MASFRPALTEAPQRITEPHWDRPVNSGPRPCHLMLDSPYQGSRTGLPPPISTSVPGTPPVALRTPAQRRPGGTPPSDQIEHNPSNSTSKQPRPQHHSPPPQKDHPTQRHCGPAPTPNDAPAPPESVRVTDVPAHGRGRAYLVERELEQDGYDALKALVSDYLEQATCSTTCPRPSRQLPAFAARTWKVPRDDPQGSPAGRGVL